MASQYNNTKLFDLLMTYNPNKNIQDKSKSTALHIACKYNNSKIIPYLITLTNANMKDINGQTPLMVAIKEKNYECITMLLSDYCKEYSIDINTKDNNGNTPLINMIIKFNDSKELVGLIDLLIGNGANKDDINHDKSTALHIACKYSCINLISKLITLTNANMEDKNGHTPLMVAIKEKKCECIMLSDYCKEYSIDINTKDNNGNTLLMNMIIKINDLKELVDLIDLLIKNGANKDDVNHDKSTALHIACKYSCINLIPKLITLTNANMKDINGQTPLMIAYKEGNYECVRTLLSDYCKKYNIDVNTKDNNGNTLLMNMTIKFNDSNELVDLVDLLIKNGANRDDVNHDRSTALHLACQYNHSILLSKLITENNVDSKNKKGETPLMMAYNKNNIQCITELLTNDSFIKYKNTKASENILNILLFILKNNIEDDKIYETLLKWEVCCFGLKQFKKNINLIIKNNSFIRAIIKNGFFIHGNNNREHVKTPLIFSITHNFKELTKSILNGYQEQTIIPEIDDNNQYCLFYAIDSKDEAYFDLLIKSKKIDFEKEKGEGQTPLKYSLSLKKETITKALLKEYIDKYEENQEEKQKLTQIIDTNSYEIQKSLIELGKKAKIDFEIIKQVIYSINDNNNSNTYSFYNYNSYDLNGLGNNVYYDFNNKNQK
ncbi:hypothetical protein PIROE2DRAFT_63097 [Piromyces sp. E2]|nr:hypothetical protein PIROE2DRAFT_63097 [Piromyces sp. E2]|eukprot:OUM60513.1 hypothetical protein PIROE2DRAFT_63097 [Piromyces sp. E2]